MSSSSSSRICFVFLVVCAFIEPITAQPFYKKGFGGNVGVACALGNRFQRFGIVLQGYYLNNAIQVNTELRAYYNLKNLGPAIAYPECVASLGALVGYGKKTIEQQRFIGMTANQTNYTNSFAYSYNLWFNTIKTTQQTGIISLQFGTFSIITENDLLARPTLDRYRTGAVLLQYQKDNYQVAINCTMWTGQMGHAVRDNLNFPAIGYIDTLGGIYTQYSHGLLSGQFKWATDYGQHFQANAGVDAEHVRNAVQNKLIHDMVFIPRKWYTPTNCHIPMLDEKGNQYLYEPHQKIKQAKLYWNLFSNANTFY